MDRHEPSPFAPAALEMSANELDFAQGSITSAVTALAATPAFKLFAEQDPDRIGEGILVPADSPIKSVQDLIGKTVAVNKGGTGEYLLRKALAAANIPASKVTFVYLSPPETAPVLNSGKVDAWATWNQYSVAEVGLDNARFVATGAQIGSQNYSVWAVRTGFAQKYPKIVAAFYNYLHTEGLKLVANPAEFINVFTTAGPEALNPAEVTFDAKDSAALGTTERDQPDRRLAVPERGDLLLVGRGHQVRDHRRAVHHPAGKRRMTADTGVASYPGLVTPRPQLLRPRRAGVSITLRVAGPVALLVAWWAASASGALSPAVLASPQQVASAAWQLWQSGQLQSAVGVSVLRAATGLLFGVSAGLALGVITGFSRLGEELLDSPLQLLRALPFL